MPKRCVAYGCGNMNKDGFSLFSFPKNPSLKKQWTDQVRRTRDGWSGPAQYSFLCHCHFAESCFEADAAIATSLTLKKRLKLKPDAVPTMFKRPNDAAQSCNPSKKLRSSRSIRYKRREEKKVCMCNCAVCVCMYKCI